ncbi:MAG TPA: DUF1569 domain-containing protein [Candidatus Sulfotelmatobacter sp.]|nr:DUF1569 domain-containing protein [Candidatus Sulfotelmatobacter sp.]
MDRHLERLKRELAEILEGVSAEQLAYRLPGKWSTGEVVEHLYLTYTGTSKGFQRVAEAGRPLATKASWKQSVGRRFVLGFEYLPSGRESPSTARPRGLPGEKVVAEILSKIDEMDEMIRRCEGMLGPGKLLDHPILGPLTGPEWRKFHMIHGLHHIKQIRRLQDAARKEKKKAASV